MSLRDKIAKAKIMKSTEAENARTYAHLTQAHARRGMDDHEWFVFRALDQEFAYRTYKPNLLASAPWDAQC